MSQLVITGLGQFLFGVKQLNSIKLKYHQPHKIAALCSWDAILVDTELTFQDGFTN